MSGLQQAAKWAAPFVSCLSRMCSCANCAWSRTEQRQQILSFDGWKATQVIELRNKVQIFNRWALRRARHSLEYSQFFLMSMVLWVNIHAQNLNGARKIGAWARTIFYSGAFCPPCSGDVTNELARIHRHETLRSTTCLANCLLRLLILMTSIDSNF